MRTLLAISPHLDDAVFSAGALLARHADEGWRVVIATCFTASMPNPQGFALACQLDKGLDAHVDYMALRRDEDNAACALLGCEPMHLAFPEAPHRGYDSADALFGELSEADTVAEPLSAALEDLHRALEPDLVLGPATIGGHVDHVIVRRIIETFGSTRTGLWADFPYAARIGFDPKGFEAAACGELLPLKIAASLCYATQLGFQFASTDALDDALQIEGAEWFGPVPIG